MDIFSNRLHSAKRRKQKQKQKTKLFFHSYKNQSTHTPLENKYISSIPESQSLYLIDLLFLTPLMDTGIGVLDTSHPTTTDLGGLPSNGVVSTVQNSTGIF